MSSIWAPPSAQEYPAQPSTPVDKLMDRIRKLEGLVAELTKGSPLRQAGMGVSPGQIDFDGNVVISGTLSLPAGIIDNEALASPLAFREGDKRETNFSVAPSYAVIASFTIVTPPGFTSVTVTAIGSIYMMNKTSNLDYLVAYCRIASPSTGSNGIDLVTPLTALNGSGALTVSQHRSFSGLAASAPLTVTLYAASSFAALPSDPLHRAGISASAIFAR